ncbi:EipA family protein, partial [Acinetobacter baumannii]
VYWAGPSIGFDLGANAAKVFTLVYRLPQIGAIYQRFPGVDGSLYYLGGAGINYQRLNGITLVPIRLGVGLRAGASVGYI